VKLNLSSVGGPRKRDPTKPPDDARWRPVGPRWMMRAMPSRLQRTVDGMIDRITKEPFIGAWRAVTLVTLTVTVAGGLLMRLTDPNTFDNVWLGLWWSVQTVTTVGYGDVLPQSIAGRIIAVLVMLLGVAFIAVTTAAIASAFVEAARRRRAGTAAAPEVGELQRLRSEVEALAAEVRALREGREPPS
jgi:voltage-gated potassium channel